MTWFAAGAAVVGTLYSSSQAAKSGAKSAGAQSLAEGKATVAERLNTTIRNSYSTAASQMQLGLKKKQLSQQGAQISAAALAAKSDATLANASTGSIGASSQAVISDIEMKAQEALDMTTDSFESAVDNYNTDLNMMVVNTSQSAPTVRDVQYQGPSSGEMIGGALMSGAMSFASSYASRKISLGLGPKPTAVRAASNVSMFSGARLGNSSNFFNTQF